MAKKILLTGATGYIGARLAPRLIEKGYDLVCLVRNPEEVRFKSWSSKAKIIKGDVYCTTGLKEAFEGIDCAYYLVHSMGEYRDFEKFEEISAHNFGKAALEAKVSKIIYLGGLVKGENLSRHFKSRIKVGEILRSYIPNTVEFRAGIIVGSGSVSFEMIRYLSERLPFIPDFRYLRDSKCQPIAIRDVLSYLISAIENSKADGKIIEISGQDTLSYRQMMEKYCKIRGIHRINFPCPSPSHKLCAFVISLVAPVSYNIALALMESLKNDAIKSTELSKEIFPEIKPLDYETAVKYALQRIAQDNVESIWTTSYIPSYHKPCAFIDAQGIILQDYNLEVKAAAQKIFEIFYSIGGENGYYFANWLWQFRAFLDKLIGGIGMRGGRRSKKELHQGETLDFWRVERIIPGKMMLLRAEMKLPGRGWLQFQVNEIGNDKSLLRITAYFEPKGFFGYIYWYLLYPIHTYIFKGLIRKIKEKAESFN